MGSKGGDEPEMPDPRTTGPANMMAEYMFGYGAGQNQYRGITDPGLQKRILGAEKQFRPQYLDLELTDLSNRLYGLEAGRENPRIKILKQQIRAKEQEKKSARQSGELIKPINQQIRKLKEKLAGTPKTIDEATPGMFELSRAAAEEAGITQRSEEDLQRAADVGALEQYAPQVVEAYREADPYSTGLAESQTAMAQDLYQRAQGLNPEQQRLADQQALQMSQRVGRIGDESSVASQILGREQYLSGLRGEAAGMGQQAFGMNRVMAGDPMMAILGRGNNAAAGGAGLLSSAQGLRTGPALFDPNAGINYGMQSQANMMGLQGAQAQAGAARSAGMSGMIGQIGSSILGSEAGMAGMAKLGGMAMGGLGAAGGTIAGGAAAAGGALASGAGAAMAFI